jgi:hypothetical protein
MTRTRARRDEPSPAPGLIVLRGDVLDSERLAFNAQENHDNYGFYGLSVYVVPRRRVADALAHQLWRRQYVNTATVGQVYAAGLWLDATGNAPHYDVVRADGTDMAELVEQFLSIPFHLDMNPHYRGRGQRP